MQQPWQKGLEKPIAARLMSNQATEAADWLLLASCRDELLAAALFVPVLQH
jgi:hypothetical protein